MEQEENMRNEKVEFVQTIALGRLSHLKRGGQMCDITLQNIGGPEDLFVDYENSYRFVRTHQHRVT